MRITDKQIPMETELINKIDLLIKRCTQKKPKLDSCLLIDGYEGYGKTTLSVALGFYIHYVTKRPFSSKSLFFDVDNLIKFAQTTENQIIIWDEGALGGLSSEWFTNSQRNLTKLLMTCRKKRHFIIINIPRVFKLNEYLALDRCLGLVHVYARNEIELGRFVYFNRKQKDKIYEIFKRTRIKTYKNYTFHGSFPDVLDKEKTYNILDIFNINDYDERKEKAIQSIGNKKTSKTEINLLYMKYKVAMLPNLSDEEKSLAFGVVKKTIQRWKDIIHKYPSILTLDKT